MAAAPQLSGLRVLLLEDDPLTRRQLTRFLAGAGALVFPADTLAKARRILAHREIALALLDLNLPDGLGTDLLQESLLPQGTPVFIMTSAAGVDGAYEALRLGAVDYLAKPFEFSDLAERLAHARSKPLAPPAPRPAQLRTPAQAIVHLANEALHLSSQNPAHALSLLESARQQLLQASGSPPQPLGDPSVRPFQRTVA